MDFVGGVLDTLMAPVDEFMEEPYIDETLDAAFAAIALMNLIMAQTSARPWRAGGVVDGAPIREAMLRCFDEQIEEMDPVEGFAAEQRAALVEALDTFVAQLSA